MEKSQIIKLTVVLYRVTELFPKREPLKFSLRKKANDILAEFVLYSADNPVVLAKVDKQKFLMRILNNIEVVQAFFSLAKTQDWLRPENFLVLKQEYSKITEQVRQALAVEKETAKKEVITRVSAVKEPIKRESPVREQETVAISTSPAGLKSRHKQIIKFVKSRGVAQVKDVKEILPEVTKRTLRRDFDFLLKQGLVQRRGDKNMTEYLVR